MKLFSDREITIRQKPSPFGQGFILPVSLMAEVVLLCRNLPAQQSGHMAGHPLSLSASSEAGGKSYVQWKVTNFCSE
jgi:hypothetical protein